MSILSIVIIIILSGALITSVFYLIRFGTLILKVQDVLEDALDILDERYASIDKVIKTPLFYDSPEVRRVLNDVRLTREAILNIAKELTDIEEDPLPPMEEPREKKRE